MTRWCGATTLSTLRRCCFNGKCASLPAARLPWCTQLSGTVVAKKKDAPVRHSPAERLLAERKGREAPRKRGAFEMRKSRGGFQVRRCEQRPHNIRIQFAKMFGFDRKSRLLQFRCAIRREVRCGCGACGNSWGCCWRGENGGTLGRGWRDGGGFLLHFRSSSRFRALTIASRQSSMASNWPLM